MTQEQRDRLRELAERVMAEPEDRRNWYTVESLAAGHTIYSKDYELIAAAKPSTIRALLDELASAEAALAAERELLDPDANYDWSDEDEELVDVFHAELKRQGAFSIEKHGKIALAMAPFIKAAFQSIGRRARSMEGKDG